MKNRKLLPSVTSLALNHLALNTPPSKHITSLLGVLSVSCRSQTQKTEKASKKIVSLLFTVKRLYHSHEYKLFDITKDTECKIEIMKNASFKLRLNTKL